MAVLKEVMLDKEAAPNARVQSAKNVLDIAYRSIELNDIQEQLDELKHTVGKPMKRNSSLQRQIEVLRGQVNHCFSQTCVYP